MKPTNITSSFSKRDVMFRRKALETAEQPFNFIAPLVHLSVVLPRLDSVFFGRHDGNEAEIDRQLPRLVALPARTAKSIRASSVPGSAAMS